MAFSVAFTFDAIFSVRFTRKSRPILSPSPGRFLALLTPCTAQSRWDCCRCWRRSRSAVNLS